MIHAYNEMYLDDAMKNLGEAFDYAGNDCGLALDDFFERFLASGIAEQFENGTARVVSGMSGVELVWNILECATDRLFPEPSVKYDRSPEYWCGFILAYYQWDSGRSFKNIHQYVSMDELLSLYPALHEASEPKAARALEERIRKKHPFTNLRTLRKNVGYSQRVLSVKSGVSLRMIQQYEQREKDINKACGENLLALSKVLGCRMEDLMENDV